MVPLKPMNWPSINFLKNKAFTIVELMVTVAIISILSSIAFRSFKTFLSEQKLRAGTIEAAGFFRMARAYAMKKTEICTVGTITKDPVLFGVTSNNIVRPCTFAMSLDPARESGSNKFIADISVAITFTPQGFVAGSTQVTTVTLGTEGTSSMGCLGISAPSGMVRVGWKSSQSTSCDFTKGE